MPPLAHMCFGASAPGAVDHDGLQPLDRDRIHEVWHTAAIEGSGRDSGIAWRADSHTLFGSTEVTLSGDTARLTRDLYRAIFGCIHNLGFPYLLRVWHYLPGINVGAGDSEHYKRFCMGRAEAFDEWAGSSIVAPAGTAIGTRTGNKLQIYFLAARSPGRRIENPRQVSAFEYPRRYGPRGPMFSRAMIWPQGDETRLLVSGTASIVGHQSRHAGDLEGQLQETWRNLESLRASAGATGPAALRVYVRHETDYQTIREFLEPRLTANVAVLYLHADICRSELLVEIEGVYDIPRDKTASRGDSGTFEAGRGGDNC